MRIIKVKNNQNILNEDGVSAGFNQVGFNNSGFSYAILPLSRNLEQKGNDEKPKMANKGFKCFVGDMVTGYCPYDGKKHKGIIKYLYYDGEDQSMPKYAYVHDMENNDTIPLKSETVKKCVVPRPSNNVHKNYFTANPTQIGYDLQNYSPVANESKKYNFNKAKHDFNINEALDLEDDVEDIQLQKISSAETRLKSINRVPEKFFKDLHNVWQEHHIKQNYDIYGRTVNSIKDYEELDAYVSIVASILNSTKSTHFKYIPESKFELRWIIGIIDNSYEDDSIMNLNCLDVSKLSGIDYALSEIHHKFDISGWDVSNVESFEGLFDCTQNITTDCGIDKWDTHNVKQLRWAFASCENINVDLSSWDTSSVISMNNMFDGTRNSIITGLDKWDTSNVQQIAHIFYQTEFNNNITKQISNWNLKSCMIYTFAFSHMFEQEIEDAEKYRWTVDKNNINLNAQNIATMCGIGGQRISWLKDIIDQQKSFKYHNSINNDKLLDKLRHNKHINSNYDCVINSAGNMQLQNKHTRCSIQQTNGGKYKFTLYSTMRFRKSKGRYIFKEEHSYNSAITNAFSPLQQGKADTFNELVNILLNNVYINWPWNPDVDLTGWDDILNK